eukprot:2194596-Rhodomonas_salina.1
MLELAGTRGTRRLPRMSLRGACLEAPAVELSVEDGEEAGVAWQRHDLCRKPDNLKMRPGPGFTGKFKSQRDAQAGCVCVCGCVCARACVRVCARVCAGEHRVPVLPLLRPRPPHALPGAGTHTHTHLSLIHI